MSSDDFELDPPSAPPFVRQSRKRFQLEDDLDEHERFDMEGPDSHDGLSEVDFSDRDEASERYGPEDGEQAPERVEFEENPSASGFQRDTFEQWASLSKKYDILDPEELDRLTALASHDDPEVSEIAVEKLVLHNIRWILSCAHKYAGKNVMTRSGELRNEVLAEARMGFVIGLHKYDEQKALERGEAGHRKSLLKYTEFWIRKRVGALLKKERFGLNVDAALDRDKVVRAEKVKEEILGRTPTDEEVHAYLGKQARERLAEEGNSDPELSDLRKKGALTLDRVKRLRRHQTENISLDASASGDEEAPSLGDYIANSDQVPDDRAVVSDMQRRVASILRRATHGRLSRMTVAMSHGMPNEAGTDRYEPFNDDELGFVHGATRDTVRTRRSEIEDQMRGQSRVAADELVAPGRRESGRQFLSRMESEEDREEVLGAELGAAEILAYYGIDSARDLKCVISECEGALQEIGADDICCSTCGRQYASADLIRAAHRSFGDSKPTLDDVVEEAGWIVSGVSPRHRDAMAEDGTVQATSNQSLNRKLRRML